MTLKHRNYVGGFGSLDNSTSEPAGSHDSLVVARDVEHDRNGELNQRPGHREVTRVGSVGAVPFAPILTTGATTGNKNLSAKITFVTAAGETDDTFATAASYSGGDLADAQIGVPFHLLGVTPTAQVDSTNTLIIPDIPDWYTDDLINGWELWSRGPAVQDETMMGANPDLRPLYHRRKPMAKVLDYVAAEKKVVLDRPIPSLLTSGSTIPDRSLDIRFPDRAGLPVVRWVLYIDIGIGYREFASGSSPSEVFWVDGVTNATLQKPPSLRVTRTAPTYTTGLASYTVPETGKAETRPTGIVGGEWVFHYSWRTDREDYRAPPGWDLAREGLGRGFKEPSSPSKQHLWPSTGTLVAVNDDEKIDLTLPAFPTGIREAWIWAKKTDEDYTDLNFITNPSGTHRAYLPLAAVSPYVGQDANPDAPATWRGDPNATEASTANYAKLAADDLDSPGTMISSEGRILQLEIDVTSATSISSIEVVFRYRTSSVSTGTVPAGSRTQQLQVRAYDFGGSTFNTVKNFDLKDARDGKWRQSRVCFEYISGMEETDGGRDRVVVTFDVDADVAVQIPYVKWAVHQTDATAVVDTDTLLQRKGVETTSVTFDTPLVPRGGYAAFPDTTGQAPLTKYAHYQVGYAGAERRRLQLFVGCMDSVLVFRAGEMFRIFAEESSYWSATSSSPWRFTSMGNRVFFCNRGKGDENGAYDGVQVHGMGIGTPEALQGSAIPVVEPETPDETYEAEYYIVYKRVLDTLGRSYVERSEPAKLTETITIPVADDLPPQYRIIAPGPRDPKVTHVEIYRTRKGTARAYLTEEVPIRPQSSGESGYLGDGEFVVSFIDVVDDNVLGREIEFSTGKPKPASMMRVHREINYLVPQADPFVITTSRIARDGFADPTGFPSEFFLPPQEGVSSPYTALAPYGDGIVCHHDNGFLVLSGTPPDLNVVKGFSDSGAVAPDAWVNVDNAQMVLTRKGPQTIIGLNGNYFGYEVEGSIKNANFDETAAERCRCALYRTRGRAQVWFNFTEKDEEIPSRSLVFDLNVGPGTGESRSLWAEFVSLRGSGPMTIETGDGDEVLVFSDRVGAIHLHDTGNTDNGLMVEWEAQTMAMDITKKQESFRPWWIYWLTAGDVGNGALLDVRKDFSEVAMHPRSFFVDMGVNSAPNFDTFSWGDGTTLGDTTSSARHNSLRFSGGRIMQQIQLRLFAKAGSMPPGTPQSNECRLSGYSIRYEELGNRRAKVLS